MKRMITHRTFLIAAVILLVARAAPARADALPLEEKGSFERALADKADAVVNKVVGPGKAKITVEAEVDFTKEERFRVGAKAAPAPAPAPATAAEKKTRFAWESLFGSGSLMPGIPALGGAPAAPAATPAYEHKTLYSADFIKRLAVTLILDESVPASEGKAIMDLVSSVLGLRPERDTLTLVRLRFSTPWQTVWQSEDSTWLIVRYAIFISLTLVTLLVVGLCLVRLASAMSRMAEAQLHQIQMDLPKPRELPGPLGAPGRPADKAPGAEGGQVIDAQADIELSPEHVEDLPVFLRAPENAEWALPIMFLLKPEQAAKVLTSFPDAMRRDLATRISETVQVEPEVLAAAREKLKVFVESHVAGQKMLKATLALLPEDQQGSLRAHFRTSKPKLARELEASLLRFEDLAQLEPEALSNVLTEAPVERLSLALRGTDPEFQQALLGALPERMRAAVTEYLQLTPPQRLSTIRQARKEIVELWKRLAAEGRVLSAEVMPEPMA